MVFRGAWVSPNRMRGEHWGVLAKLKAKLKAEVTATILTMSPEDKERVLLKDYGQKREIQYTIVTRRGNPPDADNAVAGLKMLQDCLQRIQVRKMRKPGKTGQFGMMKEKTGPGVIWDDSPTWLHIRPVQVETETSVYPEGTRYVVVEVFSGC